MLDHILGPDFSTDTSFYKKVRILFTTASYPADLVDLQYASKKHMKASIFVHKWAIERFPTDEHRGLELFMVMKGQP